MLSDDAFRTRLREAIASLRDWTATNRDVAEVDEIETPEYWRIEIRPRAAAACPVELILHRAQVYDLMIGAETFAGRPIEQLDLFRKLIEAIAAGNVITRTWLTAGTGAIHSVETSVTYESGTLAGERREALAVTISRDACLAIDRAYVPYRR